MVSTDEAREEARRYVRRKRILYTVVGIWLALSLMWSRLTCSTHSSSFWFYWPMLGHGHRRGHHRIVPGIGDSSASTWSAGTRQASFAAGNEPERDNDLPVALTCTARADGEGARVRRWLRSRRPRVAHCGGARRLRLGVAWRPTSPRSLGP